MSSSHARTAQRTRSGRTSSNRGSRSSGPSKAKRITSTRTSIPRVIWSDRDVHPGRLGRAHHLQAGGFWYGLTRAVSPTARPSAFVERFPKREQNEMLTCKLMGGVTDCSQDTLLDTSGQFTVAGEPEDPLKGGFLKVKPGKIAGRLREWRQLLLAGRHRSANANIAMDWDPVHGIRTTPRNGTHCSMSATTRPCSPMGLCSQARLQHQKSERGAVRALAATAAPRTQHATRPEGRQRGPGLLWWRALDNKVRKANAKARWWCSRFTSRRGTASGTRAKSLREAVAARMLGYNADPAPGGTGWVA